MTALIFVSGLGQSPTGDLGGFRAFANRMRDDYGVSFTAIDGYDKFLTRKIAMLEGEKIVVAYSNGGDAYLTDSDPWFVRTGEIIRAIIALDPKPKWNSLRGFKNWWNSAYEYPLPRACEWFCNLFTGFGRPFVGQAASKMIDVSHENVPSCPQAQKVVEAVVAEVTQGRAVLSI